MLYTIYFKCPTNVLHCLNAYQSLISKVRFHNVFIEASYKIT